jgi:tetratricopeptide (TPR) repeat protein
MAAVKSKNPAKATKKTVRDLFGDAFKALGEHKYESAARAFDKLVKGFPEEEDVLARVRTFQKVCQRAIEAKSGKKERISAEGHFDLGVYHHNNGDYREASDHFQKALKSAGPDADHVLYAQAATKIQQGSLEEGLEDLQKAAKINEVNLIFASNDPDFKPVQEHPKFLKLVGEG